MDRQDLQLMYSVLGCMSQGKEAGPWCGGCPYRIDVGDDITFCDYKAIMEDVRKYLIELEALTHDDGK